MNLPVTLKVVFLLVLMLLCAGISWIVLRVSIPRPERVLVGEAADFSADQAPRLFWQRSTPFYVLVAEGELIALGGKSTRGINCRILWEAESELFVDPCYGSRMNPDGSYKGSGPPLEMKHLPVEVENGRVWVQIGY